MPQKPLKKFGTKVIQKKAAANRHGKVPTMKKGSFNIKPKKARLLGDYSDGRDLTKLINASNEAEFANKAQQAGGTLKTVKAPPVLAPASLKNSKKGSKSAAGKGSSGGGGHGAGAGSAAPMQE